MARYANPNMMDAALDYLANSDTLCICEGQPTTFAEATSTNNLVTITISSGSFTKSNGSSGRRSTISACSGSVTTSGSANHMAVCQTSGSILKYVWVLTEQYLYSGNTVTTPSLYAEIQDPIAP